MRTLNRGSCLSETTSTMPHAPVLISGAKVASTSRFWRGRMAQPEARSRAGSTERSISPLWFRGEINVLYEERDAGFTSLARQGRFRLSKSVRHRYPVLHLVDLRSSGVTCYFILDQKDVVSNGVSREVPRREFYSSYLGGQTGSEKGPLLVPLPSESNTLRVRKIVG